MGRSAIVFSAEPAAPSRRRVIQRSSQRASITTFQRPTSARINQIIYNELVYARFLPESLAYFQSIIHELASDGCDAVALALRFHYS
jgi:aspartate/glutamate racemase